MLAIQYDINLFGNPNSNDDRYYGEYNNRVRRSKRDRGTNLFYTYASLHVVEWSGAEIPDEYRRRWGIETGYRVQNQVKAKTTSTNFTVRLLYQMLSVIVYNV